MFKIVSEGDVYFEPKGGYTFAVARTELTPNGDILCCFNRTKGYGRNDFTPMCAYSKDGETWGEARQIWPESIGKKSIVVTPRVMPDGRLSLAGMIFDVAGDSDLWWNNDLDAMKENKLCWCISPDGKTFPRLSEVTLPDAAAAEQPCGMFVRRNGEMLILYSPCPTIDPKGPVETNRQVLMRSRDGGKSFESQIFGQLGHPALYAESWIVELGSGILMTGSWITDEEPYPNVYFLSGDDGKTFDGPYEMSFKGHTSSITPYGDDTVLIPYDQKQYGTLGIWLAMARPDGANFNMLENQPVWEAQTTTKTNKSIDFENFTDYAFGEPHVTVLRDGTLLLVFWFDQPYGTGVHYLRLSL